MIILGIETSCDETAAAVVENTQHGVKVLSNVLISSAKLQAKYGGIIPEQAAREQLKSIIPVIAKALIQPNLHPPAIDAIAVTYGPGLIGSLLVGVETAKTLALMWNKPLIPVNHLLGHFYGNWIEEDLSNMTDKIHHTKHVIHNTPRFPCIGLLVSGGHTDLVLFKNHGKYDYLGGTRDDAAGECFDKCARLLGLPYPGGPQLAKLAEQGNPKAFSLPRPMIDSANFDFSFSGLKTAVANLQPLTSNLITDLAASVQQAIIDVLVKKTVAAAQKYHIDQIIVAGGVAANKRLSEKLRAIFHGQVDIPPPHLCTDNAAMIAAAACYNYQPADPLRLQADPNLSLLIG